MKEVFLKRYKLYTCIFVIILLFIISYLIYLNQDSEVIAIDDTFNDVLDTVKETVKNIDTTKKIKIDIKGMVVNPGVYEALENSRVIDVINMAGGLMEGADTSSLNLSKILKDENVIIVESNKEHEKVIEYEYKECECPKFNDACISNNNIVNYNEDKKDINNIESNNEDNTVSESISINSATKEELQTLSGVGESKALAIIKYREENGPFKQLEDIMNVSGIGNSLFEKIKDSITL